LKIVILTFMLFTVSCALKQRAQRMDVPKTVAFSRYLMISTCYRTEKSCRDPVVKNLEQANTSAPFINGVAHNQVSLNEEGLIFTGETRITATENAYQVDLVLHSGNSQKRAGEKLSFVVSDIDQFKETVVMDKPIAFNKGLLRAQFVFGPVLNITR
jgi:hypothetical protein